MSKKNKGNKPQTPTDETLAPVVEATEAPVGTEDATPATETEVAETPAEAEQAPAEEVKETPKKEAKAAEKPEAKEELPKTPLSETLKKAFTFKKKWPNPVEHETAKRAVNRLAKQTEKHRRTTPAVKGVHANPTYLQFPTDKWGLTKDLKAACIQLASRIAGSADKKALADEVLRICVGHIEAKYANDKVKRDVQAEKARAEAKKE